MPESSLFPMESALYQGEGRGGSPMPVIGVLAPVSQNEELLRGFRQGLKGAGFVEGENVSILHRSAEDQSDRLPALADDLARRRVAVIVAIGQTSTFAAKAATATIPIVFIAGEDPVRLGLVASLARPGDNLTGINIFAAELVAKRLQLLREMVPAAARVAVLVDPASPTITETTLRDVEPASHTMGLQVQVLHASNRQEINAAFATFARERPDALFVGNDAFSPAGASNWSTWRRSTRSPRPTRCVNLSKSAG